MVGVSDGMRLAHLREEGVEGHEEERGLGYCWVSTWHAMRGVMSLGERSSPLCLCSLCLILHVEN